MVVFLVGYMGCGKSTVGRRLARSLGYRYVDMDIEIERRAGMSINRIFEICGEEEFRAMERELLAELAALDDDVVVSTGGGVPCRGDNMEIMNNAGITVYLKMSPDKLLSRLAGGKDKRPIIRDMDDTKLLEFIVRNLEQRESYYNRASMTIDCNGVRDSYITEHVERLLQNRCGM